MLARFEEVVAVGRDGGDSDRPEGNHVDMEGMELRCVNDATSEAGEASRRPKVACGREAET